MNPLSQNEKERILNILDTQRVAVLSTIGPKDPYSCLMSFDVTRDLSTVFFSTKRARRKYRNIVHNSRVSFVVDNRDNDNFELMETKVVTIIGSAEDYKGPEKHHYLDSLKKKHPYLISFLEEEDTAIITLKIDHLYLVDNFERVQSFDF